MISVKNADEKKFDFWKIENIYIIIIIKIIN